MYCIGKGLLILFFFILFITFTTYADPNNSSADASLEILKWSFVTLLSILVAVIAASILLGKRFQLLNTLQERSKKQSGVQKVQGLLLLQIVHILNKLASKQGIPPIDFDKLDETSMLRIFDEPEKIKNI